MAEFEVPSINMDCACCMYLVRAEFHAYARVDFGA